MPGYCLDTNIFIEAKNGPYGFDIAPGFWSWLDRLIELGEIHCPLAVYDEISKGNDLLSTWAKDRKSSGLFVAPTDAVQAIFRKIADHVVQGYSSQYSQVFLSGADPWVIAQASADGLIVVSSGGIDINQGKRPKIPNVCSANVVVKIALRSDG